MQKKILTAAVAAAFLAPAAVMAQSTVVLYGLVDVNYQNVSKYQATATNKSGIANSGARSSRLGARATEDLGGGLSARAVIEFTITGDTGAATDTARQTFVSLDSKSWGEFSFGRQYTHSFGNVNMVEGQSGTNPFTSYYGMEDQITRSSNYFKYSSPLIGGGFTFGAGYAPGEALTAATKSSGNFLDYHVRWEQGPFGIGLAQARAKTKAGAGGGTFSLSATTGLITASAVTAATDFTEKDTSLGAYYKFSMVRIYGVTTASKQSGTGAAENRRLNGLKVEFPIGKGFIAASWAKSKNKLTADSDSTLFGIGYFHDLTARTQLYAAYGRVKNETGGSMGLGGAFVNAATGGTTTPGGGFVAPGADPRGFQIGMGHSF
jgi:predicted porin